MASVTVWVLGSVAVVSLLSLIGASTLLLPAMRRHGTILFLVALAAGTLVGDTFLHILPEAVADSGGFTTSLGLLVLGGFIGMFFLEVVLRWRHTHAALVEDPHGEHDAVEPFGWLNLVGDAVHNLIDGVVIAAAFLADTTLGIVTAIAVMAHEIPQELGDFAVLLRSGMKPWRALGLNLLSAMLAVAGAVAVLVAPFDADVIASHALPLIGGAFLYIAASDLIPELHHHAHGRETTWIMLAFVAGIVLMYLLLGLEGMFEVSNHAGHAHG